MSPFLFAIYVDDLIDKLRQSGYGLHIGSLFVGCILYADDIVLMSSSCYGLQKLVNICTEYANEWDIKFNPEKSQLHLVVFTQLSLISRSMIDSSTGWPALNILAAHLDVAHVKLMLQFLLAHFVEPSITL